MSKVYLRNYDEIEYQAYSRSFRGEWHDSELGGDELPEDRVIDEYRKFVTSHKAWLREYVKQFDILNKYGVADVLNALQTADALRRLQSDRQSAIDHLSGKNAGTHGKERAEYGIVNINRDIKALKSKMKAKDWAICKAWGYEKEK